jgi:hypothetical protein
VPSGSPIIEVTRVRLRDEIIAGQLRQRAALSQGGDRAYDDVGAELAQPVVGQPHRVERARPEVFHDDVHLGHQRRHQRQPAGIAIHADALLSEILLHIVQSRSLRSLEIKRTKSPRAPARPDDLGTHLGEHARATVRRARVKPTHGVRLKRAPSQPWSPGKCGHFLHRSLLAARFSSH